MTSLPDADAEARADRRTVLIALSVMLALVLFGAGFASLFASTNCGRLDPDLLASPVAAVSGEDAQDALVAAGVEPDVLAGLVERFGPLATAVRVPFDDTLRIGAAPVGVGSVVVTGEGLALVDGTGDVTQAATFPREVTVVGDGIAAYALVVGNTLTGQVDALRPLVPGVAGIAAGACVDTSAVGSPLAFLHDARDGVLVGLRTDEDGSEAVLELRDHVRGRVWAPTFTLPRAPAGLQGSRTSGALGPGSVVVARRLAVTDDEAGGEPGSAVRAFRRSDGTMMWEIEGATVRSLLPATLADEPALRLEIANVDDRHALLTVAPDVPPDAPLPLPTHGPLGELSTPDPRTVTLTLDLTDGGVLDVAPGPAPVGRDGADREVLRRELIERGLMVTDVMVSGDDTWVLVGGVLARFGG